MNRGAAFCRRPLCLVGGPSFIDFPCSVFSPDAWVHLGCGWLTADLSPDKF